MHALGFAAYSGTGKTTLLEKIIALLRQRGLRVATVKHAHHDVDIDQPGKDSWRHRQAGASQVLLVCDRRMALVQEFDAPQELDVHAMLAQLDPRMDWALVEGFKQGNLPKIELWRAPAPGQPVRPLQCLSDPSVLALATDAPQQLPQPLPAQVALLDLNAPEAIVAWMLAQGERLQYVPPKTP
ncbi:molybdopterin-guanine dinucleotide biosynthesis protein B [Comamonas denitrificans]|uniref:Molybdopterin-guanine dinucleotide biosynthesis protein B n=1 Tax=Comamonas denitrificans TaxID=117506 RepID=A0A939GX76_9BURK|nr:molybdopterin-guanine dinucleotide biosynthesis protein B [Comamonas denitrificans]MBO1248991.1 molybdopterin-guanine dinucleotide biosynthesis protein B [Comamonas denitrificans]